MSTLHCILRKRDGAAYATHEMTEWSEPMLCRLWWRLDVDPSLVEEGADVRIDTAVQIVTISRGNLWPALRIGHRCGSYADIVERDPLPAPKKRRGRVAEWRDGEWKWRAA